LKSDRVDLIAPRCNRGDALRQAGVHGGGEAELRADRREIEDSPRTLIRHRRYRPAPSRCHPLGRQIRIAQHTRGIGEAKQLCKMLQGARALLTADHVK